MLSATQHLNLLSKGWIVQSLEYLDANKLNSGVTAFYGYKNKLTLRFYSAENILRLMIHQMQDNRCLQFDCEDKTDDILNAIFEIQDDLAIDNYFGHYFNLQQIANVSVLMTEQFL